MTAPGAPRTPDADAPVETLYAGRFATLVRQGRWEYVKRAHAIGAVVILAIDSGHVLLVEQYRVPIGAYALEFPAGLVGDQVANEDPLEAAGRELTEETGYTAERIEVLGRFASSPGLLGENFLLVRASGLRQVGVGGGTADEAIVVHRVPLVEAPAFIASKSAEGVVIDSRLTLLLGLVPLSV